MDPTIARLEALKLFIQCVGCHPHQSSDWKYVEAMARFLIDGKTPEFPPFDPAKDYTTDEARPH